MNEEIFARYKEDPRDCGRYIEPDPIMIALLAEKAGADGITARLHPKDLGHKKLANPPTERVPNLKTPNQIGEIGLISIGTETFHLC